MRLTQLENARLDYTNPGSQLKDAIIRRTLACFAQGDAARDALTTAEALCQRQAAHREFLLQALGGLPASDTALNARVTGTVRADHCTIEKVIFESRPRHFVTANLYLPDERGERTGAVLFLCGHSAEGKAAGRYQTVCRLLARAGLIVLALDPVGQGERLSYYDPQRKQNRVRPCTGDHDYAGIPARLLGDSMARYMLHDAMRGLDYLISRPEVDPARLGVTGNSGGGTQTSLLMATDPRIAAAAPGTFIMSRESYLFTGQAQDAEQIWPGYTAAGFDHEDILLSIAPKPLAVLAVQSDFFPIEGTRRSVERVRRFWEMHGAAERLALFEDASVHGYTLPLARHSARFFAQHLLGREVDTSDWDAEPLAAEAIQVTRSGQIGEDEPTAEFVHHATVARVREAEAARRALPESERRERAEAWLREQVFGPRREIGSGINPRLIAQNEVVEAFDVDTAFWYPQPYVANLAHLFRLPGSEGTRRGVTVAVWAEGSRVIHDHLDWISAEAEKGRAVLVLNLAAMGPLLPEPNRSRGGAHGFYETLYKLDDELSWNGDSLCALRTWEVTRALDALQVLAAQWSDLDLSDIHLYGHGPEGLYARLASMIDPRIQSHQWEGAFDWTSIATSRYYNAYNIKPRILPGALRYFDLSDF